MFAPLRFLWNATRGHRLAPWRSEYLRWRVETYSGKQGGDADIQRCAGLSLELALGISELSGLDWPHGPRSAEKQLTAADCHADRCSTVNCPLYEILAYYDWFAWRFL